MRLRLLRFGVMLLGAFLGYVVLVIAFNWEDIPLYTLRSAITGQTTGVAICAHPADQWIMPVLFLTLSTIGATMSAVVFETIRRVVTRRPE